MFEGSKVLRLIPDEIGRGGIKTAVSSQSKNLDTQFVYNATVFMGRWASSTIPVSTGVWQTPTGWGISNVNAVSQALHNFAAIDTTNASLAPTNHLMEHLYAPNNSPVNLILDHADFSAGGIVATSDLSGGVNFCVPATFLSIRNRCFICWGGKNTKIYPLVYPNGAQIVNNVIYDPTAGSTNRKSYDIGVDAPATAPTYTLSGSATGTTSVTFGSDRVNNATSSGNWSGATKAITFDGVSYDVSGYLNTGFNNGSSCTGTGGTKTLTLTGFLLPANGDYNGLTIHITDGGNSEDVVIASYVFAGADTTVTTVANLAHNHTTKAWAVTGEQLTLTQAYTGATDLAKPYTSFSGALSWTDTGPMYAYAYYDSVTGHVSNLSPILQIKETNQSGVNVVLSNIMYSLDKYTDRFDKILIFRTFTGGSISGGVLFPIGDGFGGFFTELNTGPFGAGLSTTDAYPDTQLLNDPRLSGTPLLTNNRPPTGPLAHMVNWDGRIFANPVSDPTAIVFSCDVVDCPFGIPEESFPAVNLLRVPAEDGRVTGMRLVGAFAVIATNRYSYYIAGNEAQNYRLLRFSSTTFGVGDYQMAEFAGDTDANSAALMYLGGDAKVYMLAPGYGNVSVSDPIQDLLYTLLADSNVNFALSRVAEVVTGSQKFLLLSVPTPVSTPIGSRIMFLYDFANKVWTQHTPGFNNPFSSFAQVYQTPHGFGSTIVKPVDFVMSSQGFIYSWILPPYLAQGSDPAFIETPPLGLDRKSKKRLDFVRIYVNAGTLQQSLNIAEHWTIQVVTDESSLPNNGTTYTPLVNQDVKNQLQPPASFPIDDFFARELVIQLPNDSVNAMIGYRFTIRVNFPTSAFPGTIGSSLPAPYTGYPVESYQLYAVDICTTDLEPPDESSL